MDGRIVVAGPDTTACSPAAAPRTVRGACGFARVRCPDCSAYPPPNSSAAGFRSPTYDLAPPERPLADRTRHRAGLRRRRGPRLRRGRLPLLHHVTGSAWRRARRHRGGTRHRLVDPHPAAPVQRRLRLRTRDAAAHPAVPPCRRRCCARAADRPTSAASAGYADQPHLHREVRDFTGMSLATLARSDTGQRTGRPTCRRDP